MKAMTEQKLEQQNEAAILETITRTIVEKFHPRRIVLFGSRARGEGTEDSDYDVFVEMESSEIPPMRAVQIDRELGDRTWALDLIVYTPEEVERFRTWRGTILKTIESEGKVLYAAA